MIPSSSLINCMLKQPVLRRMYYRVTDTNRITVALAWRIGFPFFKNDQKKKKNPSSELSATAGINLVTLFHVSYTCSTACFHLLKWNPPR